MRAPTRAAKGGALPLANDHRCALSINARHLPLLTGVQCGPVVGRGDGFCRRAGQRKCGSQLTRFSFLLTTFSARCHVAGSAHAQYAPCGVLQSCHGQALFCTECEDVRTHMPARHTSDDQFLHWASDRKQAEDSKMSQPTGRVCTCEKGLAVTCKHAGVMSRYASKSDSHKSRQYPSLCHPRVTRVEPFNRSRLDPLVPSHKACKSSKILSLKSMNFHDDESS